ncbi:type II secretion system protein [Kiritimatiellota bacterium B12222]|nr:type II secretion system protein [Kiritimatiellota bacterium B12222]
MRLIPSPYSRGFTLIEMLVAISVVLLLSGMTLSALRSSKNHQVVHQAATRLALQVELAQTMALSENESVYLVIADHGALPAGLPMRAYTFIKDLDDPQLLHHWQFLPIGVVFAPDESSAGIDLIASDPIRLLANPFPDDVQGSLVEGPVRVLVEFTPQNRICSGPARQPEATSLLLERGKWFAAGGMNWGYLSLVDEDEEAPYDLFRIHFRPMSGVVRVEEVLP